jgi:hypothetical protein
MRKAGQDILYAGRKARHTPGRETKHDMTEAVANITPSRLLKLQLDHISYASTFFDSISSGSLLKWHNRQAKVRSIPPPLSLDHLSNPLIPKALIEEGCDRAAPAYLAWSAPGRTTICLTYLSKQAFPRRKRS